MLIELDFKSADPIYKQLRDQIVLGIGRGDLCPGESLPTVRQLAQDAGVNAMTVNKAYAILKSEGFIAIDRRHGATVCPAREDSDAAQALEARLRLVISEAGIKGVSKQEFLSICERVFGQMKGLPNHT